MVRWSVIHIIYIFTFKEKLFNVCFHTALLLLEKIYSLIHLKSRPWHNMSCIRSAREGYGSKARPWYHGFGCIAIARPQRLDLKPRHDVKVDLLMLCQMRDIDNTSRGHALTLKQAQIITMPK